MPDIRSKQFRSVAIPAAAKGASSRAAVDEKARTVTVVFSSTAEVDRGGWIEILDHSRGAVDMTRLADGAPVLCDHDRRDIVGVVEEATIDGTTGRAVLRFGTSARAEEVFADVVNGIRRHVSVGYFVRELVLVERRTTTGDVYNVARWEPFEISLTSIPADLKAGVGRDADNSEPEPIIRSESTTAARESIAAVTINQEGTNHMPNTTTLDTTTLERTRITEIQALAASPAAASVPDVAEMARTAINEGTSQNDFRAALFDRIGSTRALAPSALIGMGRRELEDYSMFRAIEAAATGNWSNAGVEREASLAVARLTGRTPNGVFIPYDVLIGSRDVSATLSGATGHHLVPTEHLAGSFIDCLRNTSVVTEMGATFLPGLVGDVTIPRQDSSAGFAFIDNESYAGNDESAPAFSSVSMSPRTLRGRVDITRRMLKQSAPAVEGIVRSDLALGISGMIDLAAILGTGEDNQPRGILNLAGVGLVECGDNGGPMTWDQVVDLETAVARVNADRGRLGYITNADVRGLLKKTPRHATAAGAGMIWEGDTLNGKKAHVSNVLPSNLTKGSHVATDLSAAIFGDWSSLLVGLWGGLDIEPDKTTLGDKGALILRVFQDVDLGVRRPTAFAICKDIVTA